jgi:DNA end-binding protein Ku
MLTEAIWSGALNFVLVSTPVEIVPAAREKRIVFRLLHKKDDVPLRRQMFCPADDTVVRREHIVNGYEVGPDKYVVVTDDEYAALEPRRSQTIQIDSFVDLAAIPSVYFDRPYYLVPCEGGERAYRLLAEVMQATGKAGLAKFVFHDREHVVALWAQGDVLTLMLLHHHEQIADREAIRPKQARPQPAKVGALAAVMQRLRGEYNPAHYLDQHREQVLGFLQEKAKQQGTVAAPVSEEAGELPVEQEQGQDLVSALEESLARARTKTTGR